MSEQPMYTYTDAARSMRERAAEVADQPAEWSRLESPGDRIRALPLLPGDESTETATVHAATPEGITPCGAGIHDVTTTARIAEATCLDCLRTLAQAETAGRGDEGSTAPRDSDLTQAVRALVKRYGAPNVAYVAAQQAQRT